MATPSVSLNRERLHKGSPPFDWLCFWRASRSTTANTKNIHDFVELDTLMAKCILDAESQAEGHHSDQRVSRRVGRATAGFLVAFRDYCHAYSGVVQLMAGVSQGYSTTALETLSIFVLVSGYPLAARWAMIRGPISLPLAPRVHSERTRSTEQCITGCHEQERNRTAAGRHDSDTQG